MRGLSYRRHQMQRAKSRALRYLRWILTPSPEGIPACQVGRYATDRVPCSCRMCGNPRRYYGDVTTQELRASCVPGDADD